MEKNITIEALFSVTSRLFQVKTRPNFMGDARRSCRSRDRKNIFRVEIKADMISMEYMVKKTIIKIFSLRNNLKAMGNSC